MFYNFQAVEFCLARRAGCVFCCHRKLKRETKKAGNFWGVFQSRNLLAIVVMAIRVSVVSSIISVSVRITIVSPRFSFGFGFCLRFGFGRPLSNVMVSVMIRISVVSTIVSKTITIVSKTMTVVMSVPGLRTSLSFGVGNSGCFGFCLSGPLASVVTVRVSVVSSVISVRITVVSPGFGFGFGLRGGSCFGLRLCHDSGNSESYE
jgi:hypothetical protein